MTKQEKAQISIYLANINRALLEIQENIEELEKDIYD